MKTLINENSKSSSNKLSRPQGIEDMFLYRINRLRAKGGGVVLRYCEGEFGITRREWVILAILSTEEVLNSSALASRAELTPPANAHRPTLSTAPWEVQSLVLNYPLDKAVYGFVNCFGSAAT